MVRGLGAAALLLFAGSAMADPTPPSVARLVLSQPLTDGPAGVVPCVQVDGQDPVELLLSSLKRVRNDVVRASACGRNAMLFSVSGFRITARQRAEVLVGTYRDGARGAGEKVELQQDGAGFWSVVSRSRQ